MDCMDYITACVDNAFDLAIIDDMQIGKADPMDMFDLTVDRGLGALL